jgi:hypothetical protein
LRHPNQLVEQGERVRGVFTIMSLTSRKLRLAGAFAALATLALAVGCRGFFVNPILSSLAVGPATPTIQTGTTGNTVQMTASGTFNDGSTGNPAVSWTSTPTSVATISATGLATAVSLGTATITATSTQNAAIAGSTTLTVTVGCITSIAVTPTTNSVSAGTGIQYIAMANTCNGTFDITDIATWKSSNTTDVTIDSTGFASTLVAGTVNITATSGTVISNSATLTVF